MAARQQCTPLAAAEKPSPLAHHPRVLNAVRHFLNANLNFENSAVLDRVVEELGNASTLDAAFCVPLRHKVLDYVGALKWAHFLHVGILSVCKNDGRLCGPSSWNVCAALTSLAEVYNLAVQDHIWEHVLANEADTFGGQDCAWKRCSRETTTFSAMCE